jgi:hypothetical protein
MHCTITQTWRGVPSEQQVEVAAAEPVTEPVTEPKTGPASDTPVATTEPETEPETEPKTEPETDSIAAVVETANADATAFDEETPEQLNGSTDLVSTIVEH